MAVIKYKVKGGYRYMAKFQFQGEPVTKGGFKRVDDTKEWIATEKKRLKNQPEEIRGAYLTFVTDYLNEKQTLHKDTFRTRRNICGRLMAFIVENGGSIDVALVDIQRFIEPYISSIPNPKTSNRHLRELRVILNWGIKKGHLRYNPTDGIEKRSVEKYIPYVPPIEDIASVILCADTQEEAIIVTYLHTAARLSEVLNLEWDDINFDLNSIRLWTRKRKGGDREPRVLRMTGTLAGVLKRQWKNHKSEYVFTHPTTGEKLKRDHTYFKFMLNRLCKKAGVKYFSYHKIRHRVASEMYDSGKADVRHIQKFLGHTKMDTTEKYLHGLSVVENVMDDILNPKPSIRLVSEKE
jgi:integrase